MKVVKLNRRFKKFKEDGHTVALRFNKYSPATVRNIEDVCRLKLGFQYSFNSIWSGYFGCKNGRNSSRPYWISFRNEADLTLVLLSVDLTQKV